MKNNLEELLAKEAIRETLLCSVRFLDLRLYSRFIDMFAEKGRYILSAKSDEIGQIMTWLDVSKDELAELLEEAPKHIHDLAERTHLLSIGELKLNKDNTSASAESTFSVFRTDKDGSTQVYAVGHYHDSLIMYKGAWIIKERHVMVQTRMFTTPTPTPL